MNRYRVHGHYERTMATDCRVHPGTQGSAGPIRPAATKRTFRAQRNPLDTSHGGSLERPAGAISATQHMPSAIPAVDSIRRIRQDSHSLGRGSARPWRHRSERGIHRWNVRPGKKGGAGVGKTKRGKGTKIMGLADAEGLPLAVDVGSASPHEVILVDATLDACFIEDLPARVIGDKAYDSDPLDRRLAEDRGVEMIAPHRGNRRKPATQDGRPLRRYKRRWKIERLFAWLQNFRRLVVRYEYHLCNFLAMVKLGAIVVLLRRVLG
jgi:transposase